MSSNCKWVWRNKVASTLYRYVSNNITRICVIDIPRKVRLPKVNSIYATETSYDDADESNFIFKEYGKTVFRSKAWEPGVRDDSIHYNEARDKQMLDKL